MRGAALVLVVMILAAAAASWLVRAGTRREATGLEADLAAAIERGTLADLGRAQVIGRRLVLHDGAAGGAAAGLAFACALLAVDYGAPVLDEAAAALARVPPGDASAGIAASAEALVALGGGDRELASLRASAAASSSPALPHPLYALG